jgi:hypothetical protein
MVSAENIIMVTVRITITVLNYLTKVKKVRTNLSDIKLKFNNFYLNKSLFKGLKIGLNDLFFFSSLKKI